jgi:hypothetical protein
LVSQYQGNLSSPVIWDQKLGLEGLLKYQLSRIPPQFKRGTASVSADNAEIDVFVEDPKGVTVVRFTPVPLLKAMMRRSGCLQDFHNCYAAPGPNGGRMKRYSTNLAPEAVII